MRRLFILLNGFLVLYCLSVARAESIKRGTHEYALALRDGANTRCTLRIVDAEGNVVTGANVQASFATVGSKWIKGLSDSNGLFSIEDKSRGEMIYDVKKAGYYPTVGKYGFGGVEDIVLEDGKWLPWDPTNTVVLKQVKNPVAMYAKHVETKILSTNQAFGFDLILGDWVVPVGKGVVSDFVFSVSGYWRDYRDNDAALNMSFQNQKDGLVPIQIHCAKIMHVGSAYRMPYEAPQNGYQSERKWVKRRQRGVGASKDEIVDDYAEDINYMYRIRTITNDFGAVTNVYYGKIHGDIEYGGASEKGCYLKFTYYLNPIPNDRNLEFDPKKNLFKDLKSTEQVDMP